MTVGVDFLPPDYRDRRSRKRASWTFAGVTLVVLLAMFFSWYSVNRRNTLLSSELGRVNLRYDDAKSRITQVEQLDLKKEELSRRLSVLQDVLTRTRGSLVLNAVAESAQESTLITKVDLRVTESGNLPSVEITIEGRCKNHLDVANLLGALDAQPMFDEVRMVLSEDIDSRTADKKFVVTASSTGLMSQPPAPAASGAGS